MQVSQADEANVQALPVGQTVNDIKYSEQGVWVAGGGRATRVDPRTNKVGDTIDTPALSEEIAIEGDTVWLPGTTDDGYVERITADTGQVNNQRDDDRHAAGCRGVAWWLRVDRRREGGGAAQDRRAHGARRR